jgi:hypothetical protein
MCFPCDIFSQKKEKGIMNVFSSAFEISINKEINLRNGW